MWEAIEHGRTKGNGFAYTIWRRQNCEGYTVYTYSLDHGSMSVEPCGGDGLHSLTVARMHARNFTWNYGGHSAVCG